MNLDIVNWKGFQVRELFDVEYGINMELNTCILAEDDIDSANFIGRTEGNNGVVARVRLVEGMIPQPAGIITCAGGGIVLSTFLQMEPFYSGRDLYLLKARGTISVKAKLFFITVLKANKYRYNYGRQANKTLPFLKVKLPAAPDGNPDWAWMEAFMSRYYHGPLQTKNQSSGQSLVIDTWQEFRVGSLFDSITKAKSYSRDALDVCEVFDDSAIPYVTRTDENNAVDSFVVNSGFSGLERGNAMVIGDTTSTISYQPDDFIAGDHIVVMRVGWLNVWTGLFLVSLLRKERFRYSYGRAFIMPLISDTVVKLPVMPDGRPDWAWMEQYMKSLPYSDLIDKTK